MIDFVAQPRFMNIVRAKYYVYPGHAHTHNTHARLTEHTAGEA